MILKFTVAWLLCFFVTSLPSSALAASQPRCAQSVSSLLRCLEERSPVILRTQASVREGRALPLQAREWSNPSLNIQTLRSTGNEPSGDSAQISLLFPLDLFGLRGLRERRAKLDAEDRNLTAEVQTQEVLRSGYLSLQRLRQTQVQIRVLESILLSMKVSLSDYGRRPRLTPEQQASRETLILAQQETRNRFSLARQDADALSHDIEIQINEPWEASENNLPGPPSSWPLVEASPVSDSAPAIRKLRVIQDRGDALADLSRTEKHPILHLGPAIEWSSLSGQSGFRGGITLQLPLPLTESYSATREWSELARARARVDADTELREVLGEMAHNMEIYRGSVAAIALLEPPSHSWAHIQTVEALFRQGLVAGSSYLEALRQTLALRQSRDELEIKALDSWCRIQALNNHFERCFL